MPKHQASVVTRRCFRFLRKSLYNGNKTTIDQSIWVNFSNICHMKIFLLVVKLSLIKNKLLITEVVLKEQIFATYSPDKVCGK
jgi:hypothetical protein